MTIDNVELDRELPGNLTTLVLAFGGWIDAGQAATGALRHLIRDLDAPRVASIVPEEFFVFTQERPEVRLRRADPPRIPRRLRYPHQQHPSGSP